MPIHPINFCRAEIILKGVSQVRKISKFPPFFKFAFPTLYLLYFCIVQCSTCFYLYLCFVFIFVVFFVFSTAAHARCTAGFVSCRMTNDPAAVSHIFSAIIQGGVFISSPLEWQENKRCWNIFICNCDGLFTLQQ